MQIANGKLTARNYLNLKQQEARKRKFPTRKCEATNIICPMLPPKRSLHTRAEQEWC